jgi:hypothetical protein
VYVIGTSANGNAKKYKFRLIFCLLQGLLLVTLNVLYTEVENFANKSSDVEGFDCWLKHESFVFSRCSDQCWEPHRLC